MHWIFPSTLIYPQVLPALSLLLSSVFRLLTDCLSFGCRGSPTLAVTLTLSLLSAVPPLPTRHAHLCLLYVLWQRDNLLPGQTRIAVAVENGRFFFFSFPPEWVCFSLWGDLQWQSAWLWEVGCVCGGGLLPTPRDNGPDAQGGGRAEGPASQKRPWFF